MNSLKPVFVFCALIALATIAAIHGCKKDTSNNQTTIKYCDTFHCPGHFICDNDAQSCTCPEWTGYKGANCDIEIRARYIGTFLGYDDCIGFPPDSSSSNYTMVITRASDMLSVKLNDLTPAHFTAIARESGSYLGIDTQAVGNNMSGYQTMIWGYGYMFDRDSSITFYYTISSTAAGGTIYNCNYHGIKQ